LVASTRAARADPRPIRTPAPIDPHSLVELAKLRNAEVDPLQVWIGSIKGK
jgi:hypothetical protein